MKERLSFNSYDIYSFTYREGMIMEQENVKQSHVKEVLDNYVVKAAKGRECKITWLTSRSVELQMNGKMVKFLAAPHIITKL